MNERDSEIIANTFIHEGFTKVETSLHADVVIINTCSIREKAQQKVMSLLGQLRAEKKGRPHMKICVAGCVAQQEGRMIIDKMPHVDLVVGTQNIYQLPQLLRQSQTTGEKVHTSLVEKYEIPPFLPLKLNENVDDYAFETTLANRYSRFVTIMQGCNNFCTYCVVPYTRGRESSRRVEDIIDEVKTLVDDGVVEITLLGQNVNSYGKTNRVDTKYDDFSFPQLLKEVSAIPGVKRLRFTTSNPKDLTNELMECFRVLPNLCHQFHLPVQSGSDAILQRMNRKYSRDKYLDLIRTLREYCPDIAITTDVIVGFPGETEKDFQQTLDILEQVQFDGSFSFKYSDRPGTASLQFDDKVPENIKTERLMRFQKRQKEISLQRNRQYIGKTLSVLVEKNEENGFKCRTETNHIVHVETEKPLVLGSIIDLEIFHAGFHSLKGKLLSFLS